MDQWWLGMRTLANSTYIHIYPKELDIIYNLIIIYLFIKSKSIWIRQLSQFPLILLIRSTQHWEALQVPWRWCLRDPTEPAWIGLLKLFPSLFPSHLLSYHWGGWWWNHRRSHWFRGAACSGGGVYVACQNPHFDDSSLEIPSSKKRHPRKLTANCKK